MKNHLPPTTWGDGECDDPQAPRCSGHAWGSPCWPCRYSPLRFSPRLCICVNSEGVQLIYIYKKIMPEMFLHP